jgi:serine/threonine protein kinase
MSKCFNPECLNQNPEHNNYCEKCGNKLLLMEHYRAIKYLGEGGFGRTFLGIDQARRNTKCVIKQFLPLYQGTEALDKCVQLFEQEAELLDKLGKYSQIPDLLAFFEQEKRLYLIQEFIEGQDLFQELQERKKTRSINPYSEAEIKQFLIEMLPVLDFIHKKNVIHRDIKPDNIIRRKTPLDPDIIGRKVSDFVLIDFGVSKQATANAMTKLGTGIGTPGYAAPEQSRGLVYPSSDIYSLAVTAVRLLTGIVPQPRDGTLIDEIFDIYNLRWIWQEWLADNNISIDPNLAQILNQMLADKIGDRFQTANEVLEALQPNLVTPTSPISQPLTQTKLISVKGIKYEKLSQLLAAGFWKEADKETSEKMLEAIGKKHWGSNIKKEDLLHFPSEDLQTINQLWLEHSQGKFGFSVQKEIWLNCGGQPEIYNSDIYLEFGTKIGWLQKKDWLPYNRFIFDYDQAPTGHLPAGGGWFEVPQLVKNLYLSLIGGKWYFLLSHPEL